jgi:hypothetical protein
MVYRAGYSMDSGYSSTKSHTIQKEWKVVAKELKHRSEPDESNPRYNIWLGVNGKIQRHLTPFQEISNKLDHKIVSKLNSLSGRTPMSLVVQKATRLTLLDAVQSGIWEVDPKVITAIDKAISEYESARAPFFRPNAVMSLGSIDEHSHIKCLGSHLVNLERDQKYPIDTRITPTTWTSKRYNPEKEQDEDIVHTGNELVIIIRNGKGVDAIEHQFHYRRDEKLDDVVNDGDVNLPTIYHHLIAEFIENFEIPIPKDVAELRPQEYEVAKTGLDRMEAHINGNFIMPA